MANRFEKYAQEGNRFARYAADFEQPQAGDADGFMGAVSSGVQRTLGALRSTWDTYTGDTAGVEQEALGAQGIAQTPEQRAFSDEVRRRTEQSGDDSVWQGIKNVAGAAADEPLGALHEVAAQLPNSAVTLGGMYVGAKLGAVAGSAAGPVGTVIGGFAGGIIGMLAGNTAVETGYIAQGKADDGTVTADELSEAGHQGFTKGSVITAVDAATLGLNRWIGGGAGRAVEGAIAKTLADRGVDVTSEVAVKAALSTKEIARAATEAGALAFEAAATTGKQAARGAAKFGLETAGEGVGEYTGSAAAGLDASFTEAAMESLLSVPQSVTEMRVAKKLESPGRLTGLVNRAANAPDAPPTQPLSDLPVAERAAAAKAAADQAKADAERLLAQPLDPYAATVAEQNAARQAEIDAAMPVRAGPEVNPRLRQQTYPGAAPARQPIPAGPGVARPTGLVNSVAQQTASETPGTAQPAGALPKLPDDPMVVFRDGTVARKGEIEAEVARLEAAGNPQAAADLRAKVLGYAPQAADTQGSVSDTQGSDQKPVAYVDPRLKRENYRAWIQQTVDNDMAAGGGMAVVPSRTYKMGESDKPGEVPLIRTPSVNPSWVQSLLADTGMSVDKVRAAVAKALKGERLGVRQAAAVTAILDQISGERAAPQNLDYARAELERARALRRRAKMGADADPFAPGNMDTAPDWLLDEAEYADEMDGTGRAFLELHAEAQALGLSDEAEALLGSQRSDDEIAADLADLIARAKDGRASETGTQENPREQGQGPRTQEAETRVTLEERRELTADRRQKKRLMPRSQERRQGDRRQDIETRKRVGEMTPDELRQALLTDDLTGLGNRRAYDESEKMPIQVAIDLDGLKFINDTYGHDAGDQFIAEFGAAVQAITGDGYHLSGDEFMVQAINESAAIRIMREIEAAAADIEIAVTITKTGEEATVNGVHFSYGIGQDKAAADKRLYEHKDERKRAGIRKDREPGDGGSVETPPAAPVQGSAQEEVAQSPADTGLSVSGGAKPELAIDKALRSLGIDPNAPVDKAKELRRQADKLMKESQDMLARIPAGQPINSTRDRSLRERSIDKARKASELYKEAERIEAEREKSTITPSVKTETDLLGEVPVKEQAIDDAKREKDTKRNGRRDVPMDAAPGTLFNQGQQDIEDAQGENEYPFGRVAREDQYFGSRVRVLPALRGDTAWEGTVGSVLNGGRLLEVTKDGADFSVRVAGDRIEVLETVTYEQQQAPGQKAPASRSAGRPDPGRYNQPRNTSGVESQNEMAERGGRIAMLRGLNELAGMVYTADEIDNAARENIDAMRDYLIEQARQIPGAAEAIKRYGLPENTAFFYGERGLAKGKIGAAAEGVDSNWHDTADAAAAELARFIESARAGRANRASVDAARKSVADKLRAGENPTFDEWKAAFPQLKKGHTYLRQPDISPFLIEHFGFKANNIKAGLGTAAGTVTSDTGAKYPIVYFNKLADVLGQRSEPASTDDDEAADAWDAMREGDRAALASAIGWVTGKGVLDRTGRKIVNSSWDQLSAAAKNLIAQRISGQISETAKSAPVSSKSPVDDLDAIAKKLNRDPRAFADLSDIAGPVTALVSTIRKGVNPKAAIKAVKENVDLLTADYSAERDAILKAVAEIEGNARSPSKEAAQQVELQKDVGENLWYNRRNLTGTGIRWEDVKDLNDTLKTKEVTKQKVWPKPNYEQMVKDGLNPFFARIIKAVYDGISTSPDVPRVATDADMQRYIDVVTRLKESVFAWAKDTQSQREFLGMAMGHFSNLMGQEQSGPIALSALITDNTAARKMHKVLLDRFWPSEVGKPSYASFARDSEAGQDVRIIGGNKPLKAFQIDARDIKKFMGEIADGWPAKQEAWQKTYRVLPKKEAISITEGFTYKDGERQARFMVRVGGRYLESFDTREQAQAAVDASPEWYLVHRKGGAVGQFDTQAEAIEAARQKADRKKAGGGDIRGMNIGEAERTGPEYRKPGENVTSERLMETFGFRGVNFGREGWINAAERQAYLNNAYDGLMDLADILGVAPRALSLNGALGIAFGAQGRGGQNAAHFVPGVNEINLTKTMGAGTLAHEWGHALDHYFAVMAGMAKERDPFLSNANFRRDLGDVRPEIVAAFKAISEAMNSRPETPEEYRARIENIGKISRERLDKWIGYTRKQLLEGDASEALLTKFDSLAERMRKGDLGEGYTKVGNKQFPQVIAEVRTLFKEATGRLWSLENIQGLDSAASSVRYDLLRDTAEERHIPVSTSYRKASISKDKGKGGKAYWSTPWEMFARAFETWVASRLADKAQTNTFLSDAHLRAEATDHEGGFAMPYPREDERARINAAFDVLVDAIETKETDAGVAMYSRKADSYETAVDGVLDEEMDQQEAIEVGGTPDVLLAVNAPDLPLYTTGDIIDKVHYDHGLTRAQIKRIPDLLADPVYVFESESQPGSFVVVLDETVRGKPFLAVIHPDRKLKRAQVNFIASAYAKDNANQIKRWAGNGLLRYVNTKKSPGWQTIVGVQFPEMGPAARGSGTKIVTDRDVVNKGGDSALSRKTIQRVAKSSVSDLESVLRKPLSSISKLFPVNVVQSVADLPGNHPADVRGMFANGAVWLVADNLPANEAAAALAHEAVGHLGLETLLGPQMFNDLVKIVQTQKRMGSKRIKTIVAQLEKSYTDADGKYVLDARQEAREILAHIAEGKADLLTGSALQKLYQRIKAKVRLWLASKGFGNMEDALIDSLIVRAARMVQGEYRGAGTTEGALAYQRKSQTETPEFRRWFGDSKVVDADGKPLVVYHGSGAKGIESFDPARSGEVLRSDWGDGIYFTPSRWMADGYRVGAAKERDAEANRLYQEFEDKAKEFGTSPMMMSIDLGYGSEKYNELKRYEDAWRNRLSEIEKGDVGETYGVYVSLQNPLYYAPQDITDPYLARSAKEKGHDGIIITYRDGSGIDEVIAFRPEQIKSATGNRGTFDPNDPNIAYKRKAKPAEAASPYADLNRRIREEHVTAWDKAKTWLKRQLSPGGLLPDAVFREKIKRDSEFEVIEFDVVHLVGQLERAVQADYGMKARALDEKVQRLLSDVMAGNVDKNVPEKTKTVLLGMRQYIDRLSMQYAAILTRKANEAMAESERLREEQRALSEQRNAIEGTDENADERDELLAQIRSLVARANAKQAEAMSTADTLQTIVNNMGEYVNRSYRAFDDKDWARKVPDKVLDDAREYLIGRYLEDGIDDAEAARRAEVVLNEILKHGTAYESMDGFIKESKLGAKDLSILKRRKQIAPQIRALLGEYTDPRITFAKSATKMGRLIWNQTFLDRVLEIGTGTFLWTDETKPPEATAQIATDSSEAYAPLNGLWTTPEINQAFKDALGKEQMADWYRTIVQLNGIVKWGKTVLSPTTAARNWMSAFFFTVANGHFDLRHMAKSVHGLREYFTQNGEAAKLAYLRKLKHLGVVYDTPYAGEMMRLLEDSRVADKLVMGKGRFDFKSALDLATKFYQYGDDFWKIIGFENEKRQWMKAGLPEAEAEVRAAERVRNTYPTYSMVGRGIQSLRRFPLAGTFVSFPAEIIRTTGNMLRYLAADMKDPQTRPMAMRRAAGLAIASGFAYGLQALSMALLGMDDDDDEAVRRMAAPWQRNSNLIYTGRDKDGNIRYLDVSFLDPYNYWKRPIMAITRNQPWEDSARDVAKETLTPFFGTDIAAGAIFEVLANRKESGAPVYNEHDEVLNQTAAIADHLRKNLQPGIASNLERTWKALNGDVSPSGRKYSPTDEAAAWVGFRMSTLDPKVALYYRSFDFKDAKAEADKKIRDVIRKEKKVDSGDLRDAWRLNRRLREKAFREMNLLVSAAMKAGMSRKDIMDTLKNSGVSGDDRIAILNGKVPKYRPSERVIKDQAAKARTTFGPDAYRETIRRYREVLSYDAGG